MRLLAVVILIFSGCGTASVLEAQSVGEVGGEPSFQWSTQPGELTWVVVEEAGSTLVVELVAEQSVSDVYGVALRTRLQGASFVRAESLAEWPLVRFEPTARGFVAVMSQQGPAPARQLTGTLARLTLSRATGTAGRLELERAHSGFMGSRGELRPVASSLSWR